MKILEKFKQDPGKICSATIIFTYVAWLILFIGITISTIISSIK